MKKIIMTGGGTAGHVMPNITLINNLKNDDIDIHYIGSKTGIERKIINDYNIPYTAISSGKLRRYFDFKNFTDLFRVLKGLSQSFFILKKLKPDVIFSCGGFVSVPVVFAARLNNIPVVIHELDITIGLANKISIPCANKIFTAFENSLKHMPKEKAHYSGPCIRDDLFEGSIEAGFNLTNLSKDRKTILIMGGSQGALKINTLVSDSIDYLSSKYNIIHISGKQDFKDFKSKNYIRYDYVSEEFKDLMAMSDLVISRAGANSTLELLALKKLNILIPISAKVSKGDQVLNAKYAQDKNCSLFLDETNLSSDDFINSIEEVFDNKDKYYSNLNKLNISDGKNLISDYLKTV